MASVVALDLSIRSTVVCSDHARRENGVVVEEEEKEGEGGAGAGADARGD